MNVLFLTLSSMEDINDRGIYPDLVKELALRGINMYVVFPRERRTCLPTELAIVNNIKFLKVKTGNITETNLIEKGISTLTIEALFLRAVKKFFGGVKFDLILYSTPPITFEKIVKHIKRKDKSKSYLVLKDIFPQNAVDIDMLKSGSIIWRYFRKKEKKLYEISDIIGCMSQGNKDYLIRHNPYIDVGKIEIFPNSINPVERTLEKKQDRDIFEKYDIPQEAILFVYGGNLGKPQGISFLLTVVDKFEEVTNGHLLIVGSGTEYEKIKSHLHTFKPKNVSLFNKLPKKDYDLLLELSDVGLIFLDKRFTIPNIPSRLTAYMEFLLPILAATDKNTDLKEILQQSQSGFWSESGDIASFIKNAKRLANDESLRKIMGLNGRIYLEEHYDIRKTVNIILSHMRKESAGKGDE